MQMNPKKKDYGGCIATALILFGIATIGIIYLLVNEIL
jgi:hypothetical protein